MTLFLTLALALVALSWRGRALYHTVVLIEERRQAD